MAEDTDKTERTAGASETTPSRSQYFSWINSTNEGSTEAQTLANLEYFAFLKREYGMQLDIYAWDAGNLDGARETYQTLDSPKIKAQFPNGYAAVGKRAKELGIKLGVWCGPDGFGNTEESKKKRHELMVSLCRDYNFGLFKMDAVCGYLRPEMQDEFVSMMEDCRKYSPELILLNHRLDLGKGMPYSTTSLWNGQETYVDVLIANNRTASHNREFMFSRGNVPGLKRLYEDHGVCISSCVDFFEDELIYQAFGRCLILAPEVYGNPWLLRDDEHAKLARIYNLHRTYRDILVNGILLPGEFGPGAVSRGDGNTRFITTGNDSWNKSEITIPLDETIGLEKCDRVMVGAHHPYEMFIGEFKYGDKVNIQIDPFRSCLIEISKADFFRPMLTGCAYEVLHETESNPDKVKIVAVFDKIGSTSKLMNVPDIESYPFDNRVAAPIFLGKANETDIPSNAEQLFETACFGVDSDSLESRELKRSGKTRIPEVQAARDAFFGQKTYQLRGCESKFAFDGNGDTFFDGISKKFFDGLRYKGGCLRVDFGKEYDADAVTVEYFDPIDNSVWEIGRQTVPPKGSVSVDLKDWRDAYLDGLDILRPEDAEVLVFAVHSTKYVSGTRRKATYGVGGSVRYLRLPRPMDRIYKIALIKDGKEIVLENPRANNLICGFDLMNVEKSESAKVTVTEEMFKKGCYLAVAANGRYGAETVQAVAEIDGTLKAFPRRAPSYRANVWECRMYAAESASNYTFFLPIERDMIGKEITVTLLLCDKDHTDVETDIWLCDANSEKDGIILHL